MIYIGINLESYHRLHTVQCNNRLLISWCRMTIGQNMHVWIKVKAARNQFNDLHRYLTEGIHPDRLLCDVEAVTFIVVQIDSIQASIGNYSERQSRPEALT